MTIAIMQTAELELEAARTSARLQARHQAAAKQSSRRAKLAKSQQDLQQGLMTSRCAA